MVVSFASTLSSFFFIFVHCDSVVMLFFFFFSSRRRHTRYWRDWSSDVCSSDLFEQMTVEMANLMGPKCTALRHFLKKVFEHFGEMRWIVAAGFENVGDDILWRSEERRVGKECRYRWWRYQ